MRSSIAGNEVFQQKTRAGQRWHAIDDGPDEIRNDDASQSPLVKRCPTVIVHLCQVSREKQEQSHCEIDERAAPHLTQAIGACVNQHNCYDSNCPKNLYVIPLHICHLLGHMGSCLKITFSGKSHPLVRHIRG